MKQFLFTAAMGVLFFVGLTSMVNSKSAEPYPGCQESCDFLVGAGFFSSHGACMSACHTCTEPGGGASYSVCLCKQIDEVLGGFEANGFLNMGQCLKIVKGDN